MNVWIVIFLGVLKKKKFIKHYNFFDDLLKREGQKYFFKIKNTKINTLHNTFGCDLPRLYSGTKLIITSLEKVLKKHKVKNILYFNDLENEFLEKSFINIYFKISLKKKGLNLI